MANAYFINGTPTEVKIVLNSGDQNKLEPISVASSQDSISAPAWAASISAFPAPNVFAGGPDAQVNELTYSSTQSGKTRRYNITSTVSNTLDLYFFMFEDSIQGEDQTGSSAGITITLDSLTEGAL
jgi:hypothetical protein